MNVYEKTIEKRLRDIVKVDDKQFRPLTTVEAKIWSEEERAFPCL